MGQDEQGKEKRQKDPGKKERENVKKKPPSSSAVAPETDVANEENSKVSKDEVIAPDGFPYTKKEEPPPF